MSTAICSRTLSFTPLQHSSQPCGNFDMSRTAIRYDQLHKPLQLDLSCIDPASFVNIDLPTRRAKVTPPPPPSSPRLSTAQQRLDGERSVFDFQTESCVSEINSATQVDSWSQCCSSSSKTATVFNDRLIDEDGRFAINRLPGDCDDPDGLSNIRSQDWPAHTTFCYPVDLTPSLPFSALTIESPTVPPSALRTRQMPNSHPPVPNHFALPQSELDSPVPNLSVSPSASQPCSPMTPAYPDINEQSFMDMDDSEPEGREKRSTKASSFSRLFDQKRKSHRRRGFGRSLSEVFSSFSCAK